MRGELCYSCAPSSAVIRRRKSLPRQVHKAIGRPDLVQRISETELPYSARMASMWSSMGRRLRRFHKFKLLSLPSISKPKLGKVIADAESFTTSAIDNIVANLQDIHLTVLVNNVGETVALDVDIKTLEDHTAKEVDAVINANPRFTTRTYKSTLVDTATQRAKSHHEHWVHCQGWYAVAERLLAYKSLYTRVRQGFGLRAEGEPPQS
jgi:hypothetical protein